MRTVYLGTSWFAAAVLERLACADMETGAGGSGEACDALQDGPAGRHRPVLVITRPDRPAGRGRRLRSPPVADAARELGIDVAQPANVNDPATLELIAGVRPDAVVVCAFGALVKEPLLSAHQMLNVHPSLLPRWRGAAPVERAIMAGDERTGVSIMRLTAGLDSGPLCAAGSEPVEPHDTYGTLATRLQRLGAELLTGVLDAIAAGAPPAFVEQDETLATYAEKITAADRLLDPARPAAELERVVRALYPHIGARIRLAGNEFLGVLRARAAADADVLGARAAGDADIQPGAVQEVGGRLLYGTAQGVLELLEVQPPGGRPMDAAAYLRGHAR
jgi:methionyl-tRNA formyltransferase